MTHNSLLPWRQGSSLSRRTALGLVFAATIDGVSQARGLGFLFGGRRNDSASEAAIPRDLGPVSRQEVVIETAEPPGTILVDTSARILYLVLKNKHALAYQVGIGRDGYGWTGLVTVGAKKEWPDWRPPPEMRRRDPTLPEHVPPGPLNPLGARALYLHRNGADTLYRIHGTNDTSSIGGSNSSGCFRLSNADVIDLYERVPIGTRVVVY
jgi:lipoprotein-anchoring transpeptidase ErfK/SrfK